MRTTRILRHLFQGLVMALAVSACSPNNGVLEPTSDAAVAAPRPELGVLGGLDTVVRDVVNAVVNLLPCDAETYVKAVQTIGPRGGVLTLGNHRLVIPPSALTKDVTITGEVVTGLVNSVRLSPHGLRFARPVALEMSYRNCAQGDKAKVIVYTDEALKILEVKESRDDGNGRVASLLNHFSRYAVAW